MTPLLGMLGLQVTEACDKACSMCCMSAKGAHAEAHMPFDAVARLIERLAELGVRGCEVGITGGEPLIYASQGRDLADLVAALAPITPAEIYIQTSGAGPGVADFPGQIARIGRAAGASRVRWATSYTLYQRPGIDERMAETLKILADAMVPRPLEVHLTSDPANRADTLDAFERLLGLLSYDVIRIGGLGSLGTSGDRRIAGRLSATVAAGRAIAWDDLDEERATTDTDRACSWFSVERRALHVLTHGGVYLCCTPEAYRNPTHLLNVFHDDVATFFDRAATLRRRLADVITGRDDCPDVVGRCARCNLVDHQTGALRFQQVVR